MREPAIATPSTRIRLAALVSYRLEALCDGEAADSGLFECIGTMFRTRLG